MEEPTCRTCPSWAKDRRFAAALAERGLPAVGDCRRHARRTDALDTCDDHPKAGA